MHVRKSTVRDTSWIIDLSRRVQDALTASGSLQRIGPLPVDMVERAVQNGDAYILEDSERRLGSVLVEPIALLPTIPAKAWGLDTLPQPLWYLHALMLEPEEQGKGLGLHFLEGVKQWVVPTQGTIALDCWAGNDKLRDFYRRADFSFHGVFPVKDYEVAVFFYSPSCFII